MAIKHLRVHNQSLLSKWLWGSVSGEQSLWKEVIASRYTMKDLWITKEATSPYVVGLWKTVKIWWPKIRRNSRIQIENGRRASLWNDVLVDQYPLKQLDPVIYNLNQQKEATVSDVRDNQGWNLSFRRRLNDWERENLTVLFNSLDIPIILTQMKTVYNG